MPIVFVHGVNNREGDDYRDNEAGRNGFLREIVAPALGLAPDQVFLASPYWGGSAAQFAWGMAVLPDASDNYEKFGAGEDTQAFGRAVELAESEAAGSDFAAEARSNLRGAVDLLYGATLAGVDNEEEARAIALSYKNAQTYVTRNPSPEWVQSATDENFADSLQVFMKEAGLEDTGTESFGAGGILDSLKEGLSRLKNALPTAGSDLALRLGRKKTNTTVTRFAGDSYVYLVNRGTKDKPGEIVDIVLSDLRKAAARRNAADNKLIVIAHSFGGEIMYDILSYFAPDLRVDYLVTVASQVGLFEEMKLYRASSKNIPPNPPHGKVPKPANIGRWLNVFDTNDVLAYRASPIFDDVEDFLYETGYSTFQAHGGYFLRPSFYVRLADRLTQ